ncbi:MAG: PorV/PorQ family protein [Elusimicrobiota bacterium]
MEKRQLNSVIYIVITLILLFSVSNSYSFAVGKNVGVFLDQAWGARAAALGGGLSGITDDSFSCYYNPAGLGYTASNMELSTMYAPGPVDTFFSYYGLLIAPLNLNLTFITYNAGDIEVLEFNEDPVKIKAQNDYALSIGWGRNLNETFFAGGNLKYLSSNLVEQYSSNALIWDVGLMFRTLDDKMTFSMLGKNITNSTLKYYSVAEPLPSDYVIGTVYRKPFNKGNSMLLGCDYSISEQQMRFGLEEIISQLVTARAGYQLGGNNEFTIGFGIGIQSFHLDYGLNISNAEAFNYSNGHNISINWRFDSVWKLNKSEVADIYGSRKMYKRAKLWSQSLSKTSNKGPFPTLVQVTSVIDAPIVASIKPEKEHPGAIITILGSNFDFEKEKNTVFFDNIRAEVINADKTSLRVRIPGGQKSGRTAISIHTEGGVSESFSFFIVPSKPPILNITNLTFEDEDGDNILSAEEKGNISFDITNSAGAGASFGLKEIPALIPKMKDIIINSIDIGDIEAGRRKSVKIPISSTINLPDGEVIVEIETQEANGFNPDNVRIRFKTQKVKSPDINIVKFGIDDTLYPNKPEKQSVGNGNGIVEPGESVDVSAVLANKGKGVTKNAYVTISCNDPSIDFLSPVKLPIGDLEPGKLIEIKFAFTVKKQCTANVLPIKISLTDAHAIFNKELPLDIALNKVYSKIQVVEVTSKPREIQAQEIPTFGADLFPVPKTRTTNPDGIAVVFGIMNYKHPDVPSVTYAINDIQAVREYLVDALGYRKDNIIYLENPTQGDITRVFGTEGNPRGQLSDYVKEGKSDVFVYYSGHGAPDIESKKAYLVPSDCHPNYVKLNGYPLELLYENIGKIKAKNVTIVIDACFSGGSEKGMLLTKASALIPVERPKASSGINVFTAAGDSEVASWYPDKQHSLFTYYFLKGLQGSANTNKDKALTLGELKEYLTENVPSIARRNYGRNQNPQFSGDENKVLLKYQ